SRRNGVTSSDWGNWDGSYRVEAGRRDAAPAPPAENEVANVQPDPGNLADYRNQVGKVLYFEVVGSARGQVWGTDVYTQDSDPATAAVHAGVLRPGKKGVVKVTMLAGQLAYQASTRNGVSSAPYGAWGGSYRVEAGR